MKKVQFLKKTVSSCQKQSAKPPGSNPSHRLRFVLELRNTGMDQPKMERLLRLMKLMSGNVNYSIDELSQELEMSPTNSLKANLKDKLSAIYSQTSIADFVDRKSNAARVEALGDAIKDKKKVFLRGYESGSSHTIRDRFVEPYGFTTDYIDVCAYDLEDGRNKIFKISRIADVDVTDEDWTSETEHKRQRMDIFRMNGNVPLHIKLGLSVMAKNLLLEEFPLAAKYVTKEDRKWILETDVYNYAGACRFYAGLAGEIEILESEEFRRYVGEYVKNNLNIFQ